MSSSQTGPTSKANNTNEQDQPHKLTESGLVVQHHPTILWSAARRASQAMQCKASKARAGSNKLTICLCRAWTVATAREQQEPPRRFLLLQQRWCCGCAPHTAGQFFNSNLFSKLILKITPQKHYLQI
jgi:hypothetical protein